MRPALALRALVLPAAVLAAALACAAGCGGRRDDAASRGGELSFEKLADTTGLADGPPVLEMFDAYRMDSGPLRVKGRVRFPDGTRVRVTIRRPGSRVSLASTEMIVAQGGFDSPPLLGPAGVLPRERWEFEVRAEFAPGAQPDDVLRATQEGRTLRGPGITRTQIGGAVFCLVEEMTR